MTIQTVPAYLQNASHPAAVFRQAISAAWQSPGVCAPGELAVGAQTSPNMSVRVGAGRAIIAGSQVTAPTLLSGASAIFTTQAMYQVLNDATATVTIAASDPTNPRIDTVYTAVNDAFYSGALNSAVLGVVTGTPAASPVASPAPNNSVILGYVAVAANASSIVSANVSSIAAIASAAPNTAQASTLILPTSAVGASISALGKLNFASASAVSVNGAFSTLYDNYKIVGTVSMSASALTQVNLRASGTDTTSGYNYQAVQGSGSSAGGGGITSQAAGYFTNQAAVQNDFEVNVYRPFLADTTRMVSTFYNISGSTQAVGIIAVDQTTTTLFDGFTIKAGTGGVTMTGVMRIYGWNNG